MSECLSLINENYPENSASEDEEYKPADEEAPVSTNSSSYRILVYLIWLAIVNIVRKASLTHSVASLIGRMRGGHAAIHSIECPNDRRPTPDCTSN